MTMSALAIVEPEVMRKTSNVTNTRCAALAIPYTLSLSRIPDATGARMMCQMATIDEDLEILSTIRNQLLEIITERIE